MTTDLTINIERFKCPSMNELMHKHWLVHMRKMRTVKELVMRETQKQIPAKKRSGKYFTYPVMVSIDAEYQGSNRRDTDNLYIKPILDGLVAAKVLPDDNCEVVPMVAVRVRRRRESDRVSIRISEHVTISFDAYDTPVPTT